MIALSPTDLGSSPLVNAIEVVMVLIAVLLVLSQAVKIPFLVWIGKRVFLPGFRAVVADPLKKWHTDNVTAVVSTAVAPIHEKLEKEFGGNSGGVREAINKIDQKVDANRDELLKKMDQNNMDAASQRGKIWKAIKEIKGEPSDTGTERELNETQ
jgi:hypothetical protein